MKIDIKCKGFTEFDVEDLLDFQGDLKTLSDTNYKKFKAEMIELGFSEPISVWISPEKKPYILNGHQRRKTLLKLKEEGYEIPPIPVNLVEADDLKQAKRKVLALTSQFGEMSEDGLIDFCEKNSFDVSEIIKDFRFPEIQGMIDKIPELPGNIDDVLENKKSTNIVTGDIFEIGDHRLICGDSTVKENWDKLMQGKVADLYISDPPYGVKYEGKTKEALTIKNDSMSAEDTHKLFKDAFMNVLCNLKIGGAIYATVPPGLLQVGFMQVMLEQECLRQCMLWNKGQMVLGHSDYHYAHEPILYGWKPGGSHYFTSDRTKTTVLNFKKPSKSEIHPTMKPVELWCEMINNSSKTGDIVIDSFLGSGTTMVACHQLNRICCGVELDPVYCQAIIDRMISIDKTLIIKRNGEPWG